jgi:molecular chaperone DnaK
MRKDAEGHAEEDRKRRELIEARNNADNTVYAAEKALREFGDKVPEYIKTEVDKKVADVKKASEGDDVAKIRSETEALGQVIQQIGGAVYQQQGQAAPAGEPGPNPEPDTGAGPDVVEGEVKE